MAFFGRSRARHDDASPLWPSSEALSVCRFQIRKTLKTRTFDTIQERQHTHRGRWRAPSDALSRSRLRASMLSCLVTSTHAFSHTHTHKTSQGKTPSQVRDARKRARALRKGRRKVERPSTLCGNGGFREICISWRGPSVQVRDQFVRALLQSGKKKYVGRLVKDG